MDRVQEMPVRKLGKDEAIPYALLLLADETVAVIDRYLPGSDIYVWEEAGRAIGVYVLRCTGPGELEIMNMAVAEASQGRGIGFRMLEHATEMAKAAGARHLLVGTSNAAWRPLYLYQKAGFEVDHIRKNFYREHYPAPISENGLLLNHMIVLRKELKPVAGAAEKLQ